MRQPLFLNIALRYIQAGSESHLVSFISVLSMIGLIVGVAVLLVVLSVMNGFDRELRERVLGVLPHAVIAKDVGFRDWQALANQVKLHPGVKGVAPFVTGSAMLVANGRIKGISFSGVDSRYEPAVSIIGDYFEEGDLSELDALPFGMAIGSRLAKYLSVSVGDKVTMVLPQMNLSLAGALPRIKRFTLVGIFRVGADVDSSLAIIDIGDASRLLGIDGVQGVHLSTYDLFQAPYILQDVLAQLEPGNYYAASWMRRLGNLYDVIQMQKTTMFLLLALLVAVAAFNVVSNLFMTVTQKRGDIAILRTMGASKSMVLWVFIVHGGLVGFVGVGVGLGLGLIVASWISELFAWLEEAFGLDIMGEYFIFFLPSEVQMSDVVLVGAMSLSLCVLATIYPAMRAAALDPVEVLRYE